MKLIQVECERDPSISKNKNYQRITYKQVLVDSLNEKDNQANLRWVSSNIAQIAFMKVKSKHCVYQEFTVRMLYTTILY